MITPESRYNIGTVVRVPNAAGTFNLSTFRTLPPFTTDFYLYQWKNTDRPDIVAYNLLGNSTLWWSIFDMNPEIIYPLNIPPGSIIRIPKVPIMGQGTLLQ